LDQAGLINNILFGTASIDKGRKYLATDGLEHTGRLSYEDGIAIVLNAFKHAKASANPQTMILVELVFLKQEHQFCDEADAITRKSLTKAIQNFDDSLRSLKIVEDKILYQNEELGRNPQTIRRKIQKISCIFGEKKLHLTKP